MIRLYFYLIAHIHIGIMVSRFASGNIMKGNIISGNKMHLINFEINTMLVNPRVTLIFILPLIISNRHIC